MSRPTCEGTRKDGSPCRAPALPDSTRCWVHDPDRAERTREARAAGASKGAKVKALNGRRRRLDSHAALAAFLSDVIHKVANAEMEPDVARTVIYGCAVMRHLADHEFDRRLSDVERQLGLTVRRA